MNSKLYTIIVLLITVVLHDFPKWLHFETNNIPMKYVCSTNNQFGQLSITEFSHPMISNWEF